MKKLIISIVIICGLFSLTGCQKWLDVNKNVDAPDQIDDYLYLAGIESAMQGCYWDIRALGPLTYMMGTGGYTNFANHYYSQASDAAGEMWRMNYWLQGVNIENMVNQALSAKRYTLAGIGLAIKAFSWDCIAKYHADAPCTQAYEPGRLSFDYDYEYVLMDSVRVWADRAIKYLETADETDYGSQLTNNDLCYGGNKDQWIKLAHTVIASNLACLTNKKDFDSKYKEEFLKHAALGIQTNADNFILKRGGGGESAQFDAYNNFWGTWRENLYYSYYQSEYIVQLMTGTIPQYDHETGDRVKYQAEDESGVLEYVDENYKWKLLDKQYIADTIKKTPGHYDPRVAAKLATVDGQYFQNINNADSVKAYYFRGGARTSTTAPMGGTTPNLYGFTDNPNTDIAGSGRWIFRDDAPYILFSAAELQFEIAEVQFKYGSKSAALEAFKKGIQLDHEFTASYLNPGAPKEDGVDEQGNKKYVKGGSLPGGSMISKEVYNTLSAEYLAGPYVAGISESDLTLSHIMLQKYVALWPWGALEAWTDLRKYHYDIPYTGEYPELGNGWDQSQMAHKWDEDPTKVFKGFYLLPMQVEGCRSTFNSKNNGAPCYRVRPRYNSEYMWNKTGLDALKPIGGQESDYQCSIPWFAYPGDYPSSVKHN